ncbi:DUF6114 domain-containing protein [Halostreptopolyspora alba]|uniref:DUF6114 domain-containing protein n=1 Tax=Halostreptopolyspora alba TaxID=2487137 RepID=UPI0026C0156E
MADPLPSHRRGRLARVWLRWRRWRHSRPFWGGLLMIAGGVELALLPLGPLEVGVAGVALAGMPTYMLALFVIALGAITWFTPQQHTITGILGGICALGSLVLSNLGGLFIGALLLLAGSGIAFAWTSGPRPPRRKGRRGRRRSDAPDASPTSTLDTVSTADSDSPSEPLDTPGDREGVPQPHPSGPHPTSNA